MSPAQHLQDLQKRGIQLGYRLTVEAPANSLHPQDDDLLHQLKPMLVKLLVENELTERIGGVADQTLPSTVRVHMLDKHGSVTHDETKCYMWTRELKGYGWWYACEFPPPMT